MSNYRFRMNLSRDYYKFFTAPSHGLFKYAKHGIILKVQYQEINLTELFNQNPDECLDLLERLEEADIDKFQWEQVREEKEIFKAEYRKLLENR